MSDWIRQEPGLYFNPERTRRLSYMDDGTWWNLPAEKRGGYSLSETKGPFELARLAGTLDHPPGLGNRALRDEER